MMNVTVKIAFGESFAEGGMTETIPGGIRIEVDGKEVTRIVNQDQYNRDAIREHPDKNWWYDSMGQPLDSGRYDFKGDVSVESTLMSFAKNVRTAKQNDADQYEQLRSPVVGVGDTLVLSYIDSQHNIIRLAYIDTLNPVGSDLSATIDAAVGYAVPLEELCLEVARCLREFNEFAVAGDFDRTHPNLKDIRRLADELEALGSDQG